MADDVDSAQETSDMILNATIKAYRSAAAQRELPIIGQCHWCAESFKDQRVFCDTDCEQDYQRYTKKKTGSDE